MHPMFAPIWTFVLNNRSKTMVLASAALTAGPMEPGLWSTIIHCGILAGLFGIRETAKNSKYNSLTGLLFFLIVIFTLVQDRFTLWSYILQGASALLTLYMWWYVGSGQENKATVSATVVPAHDAVTNMND